MNKNSLNKRGISVIICCYNSAGRITKTLDALAKQEYDPETLWEVILVDNNSSDNTSEAATKVWKTFNSPIKLRIVKEPMPGLANARKKGLHESSFSVLLFCDDDNWLSANYVQDAHSLIESDTSIAACGGMGIPVFETEEPYWFYKYAEAFALGSQEINNENGRLLNLYGAGLIIQKHVLDQLCNSGFDSLLEGRKGEKLSSSEDTELTYAFVLMGYKLVCSDDLKFYHYLPKERLTFNYLKKLFVAFGNDGPVRNLYYSYVSHRFLHKHIKNWSFHFLLSFFRLIKYLIVPPKKFGRVIYFNWSIAYIKRLISIRKQYPQMKTQISDIQKVKHQEGVTKYSGNVLTFETNGRS